MSFYQKIKPSVRVVLNSNALAFLFKIVSRTISFTSLYPNIHPRDQIIFATQT